MFSLPVAAMIEIERKFLVKSEAYKEASTSKTYIKQGFLNTDPERTVRIRIKELKGYITVKGISDASGLSRFEWEKEILKDEALQLINLCEEGILEKTRYIVQSGAHIYEVDEFHGLNEGLVVAEIELKDEDDAFEKPSWLGREVTGETRYYNSQLSKQPFTSWK